MVGLCNLIGVGIAPVSKKNAVKVSNKNFDEFLEFHYPIFFFRLAGGFIPNKYNAYYNHFVYGDNCDQIRCREF